MAATMKESKNTEAPLHDLPPDLHPEILSRLPVKSLLRFRCVSKPWRSLIDSDADFARLHLNNFNLNRNETRLFVEQTRGPIRECTIRRSDTFEPVSETETPFSLPGTDWHVASSLHGLVLLRCVTAQNWNLKLWNPSIRKLIDVPPLSMPFMPEKGLALGYDSAANCYKIVELISADEAAVYALGSHSWKKVKLQDNRSNRNWGDLRDHPVYFQSSLYFIAQGRGRVWDLVQFDLSKEVYSYVRIPERLNRGNPKLVSFHGGSSVQALDEYNNLLYTFALDDDSESIHKYGLKFYHLLHIKKNGDLLMRSRPSFPVTEVTVANRATRKCNTLLSRADFIWRVSSYVESLILHNAMRSQFNYHDIVHLKISD